MKKSLQLLLLTVLLTGSTFKAWSQKTYYWVAGSGDWSTFSNWRVDTLNRPLLNQGNVMSLPLLSNVPAKGLPSTADNVFFTHGAFVNQVRNGNNITVQESKTVTISGPAAARNLTWTSAVNSPIFRINNSLTIGGSLTFISNMTVSSTGGSLTFTATAPATITSAGKIFSMPITFNGTGGWTLQDNMSVSQNVTFTNGHVVAPTTTRLISFGPGARAINPTQASHVNGFVEKRDLTSTSEAPRDFFSFPVGNGTVYRPFVVTIPANTATTFIAKYFPVNPNPTYPVNPTTVAPPLNSVSQYEYWSLKQITGSNNYKVQLSYDNPSVSEDYYSMGKTGGLAVAGFKNGSWGLMGTTVNMNAETITADGAFNIVEVFTIGRVGNYQLPVRLVSFTGQQLDGQVQLKWQSSSEENTSHFEIEKSADGKNFSPVLTKKAQGNSSSLVSYNAIDNSPLSGTSYYRLKMVDLDGTFEYSKMVAVSAESELLVRAYPNPSKGNSVHLIAGNGSKLVLKSVSDLFGKQVGYQAANAPEGLQVNFAQPLPAGFYVATLAGNDNGQLVKVKFVVQ